MKRIALVLSVFAVAVACAHAADTSLPHLHRQGTATQLIVDGKPFLARGGELGNSTASNLEYLQPYWAKFKAMHLNTIVAPVYWDLIEPDEGHFDFKLVDGLVAAARKNDLKLVLLWFGTWKNSMSCYAPDWMKKDQQRFPRSQDSSGKGLEIFSPFNATNRDTDAQAFAALMREVRTLNQQGSQTVITVQVENEIGMIPEARDHSKEADAQFAAAVPAELLAYLQKNFDGLNPDLRAQWLAAGKRTGGSWTEVFGPGVKTDEIFMAWHFSRYTNAVAAAGKTEYPLPMYTNAALMRPGYQPGQYPSAGPLPHLFDIWKAAGSSLDFLSPDIYFPNFIEWARRYSREGNPLFIPEALRSPEASVNALYAYGSLDAITFSPFGIESIAEPASGLLTSSYGIVEQLAPLILEHQGRGTMAAFLPEGAEQRAPGQIRLNGYELNGTFERGLAPQLADGVIIPMGAGPGGAQTLPAGAIVIATAPDEFIIAGIGVTVTFRSLAPDSPTAGILSVEEGSFVDGKWVNKLWLNGDQDHQGRHLRLEPGHFSIQRIKLYTYR